ncbi:hypothetical protein ACWEN3_08125 [Streptomyces sp. NPDC004561]
MPTPCAHCGAQLADQVRFCGACGRPTYSPAPVPPPMPDAPPPGAAAGAAGPATAHIPPPPLPPAAFTGPGGSAGAAVSAALVRLAKGDWVGPARIVAYPFAMLLVLALVAACALASQGSGFAEAFGTGLALVLTSVGAQLGLGLGEGSTAITASAHVLAVPFTATLLYAGAWWFGAVRHLRRCLPERVPPRETVLVAVRALLLATVLTMILAWLSGASIPVMDPSSGDDSSFSMGDLMGLNELRLTVSSSPWAAGWWTAVLAGAVLCLTLCRPSIAAYVTRRGLAERLAPWLVAARNALLCLGIPVAVGAVASVIVLVARGGTSAVIPALLFAPNLGVIALGFSFGVPFKVTVSGLSGSAGAFGSGDHGVSVSLFDLHDLSGWLWLTVLLGLGAVAMLAATVIRERADRAARLRTLVCFVALFTAAALVTGDSADLSVEGDVVQLVQAFLGDLLPYGTDAEVSVGLSVLGAVLGAAVCAALGLFVAPKAEPFLRARTAAASGPAGSAGYVGGPGTAPDGVVDTTAAPAAASASVPASAPVSDGASVPDSGTASTLPTTLASAGVAASASAPVSVAASVASPASPAVSAPVDRPAEAAPPAESEPAEPAEPEQDDAPGDEQDAVPDDEQDPAPDTSAPATPDTRDQPDADAEQPLPPAPPAAELHVAQTMSGHRPQPAYPQPQPPQPMPATAPAPSAHPVPSPAPRPGGRRRGTVIAVTLLATAVVAGGGTALALRLQSHPAQPHTLAAAPSPKPSASVGAAAATSQQPTAAAGDSSVTQSSSPSPDLPQAAEQVEAMLKENEPLRGRVQTAIGNVRQCWYGSSPIQDARTELLNVADRRDDLVRRLGELAPDANGDLNSAVDALSQAWTASALADRDYGSWASDVAGYVDADPVNGCPKDGAAYDDGATEHNNEASKAKQRFVKLWAPLAKQYGLTEVSAGDL